MRSIAIYLGLALAGALFALGIRDLKINRKRKYGLFISTVLMALYLLGSRYVGAVEPAKSVRESTLSQQEQRQIAELVKTKEWQNFKAFWKKLDEIVPNRNKVKDEKELFYLGEYTGAISSERNELEKELKVLASDLKRYEQKGIVNPVALNLLERICIARLSYMAYGFKSMIMRMIPPPSLINEENALKNLERKIDSLLVLKKKDKVDNDEFTQALTNIQEEIKVFSILNTKNIYYGTFYSSDRHDRNGTSGKSYNIEEYIASFNKDFIDFQARRKKEMSAEEEKYYQELIVKYEKTKQALEELKPVLPLMNELIADLEQ